MTLDFFLFVLDPDLAQIWRLSYLTFVAYNVCRHTMFLAYNICRLNMFVAYEYDICLI